MDHDDFDQEPVRGLPEMLPPGERVLWRGAPDVGALARDALKLRWVAGYFVALFLWKGLAGMAVGGAAASFGQASFFLVLGAAACALLWAVAWCQAKATIYTVTDKRVVMRIGAALTLTLQVPFTRIAAADLDLRDDGTGSIALRTVDGPKLGMTMLWPHARPWRFAPAQPSLRCIPDAARVARLLAEAAEARPLPVADRQPTGAMPVPAE